jgi:flagellar biosynthesis protein FlhB
MAEDRDDAQKTELPSQSRLQEAADKGDVTQSPDVAAWLMLAAATAFVAFWGSSTATSLTKSMAGYLANPHLLRIDSKTAGGMMEDIGVQILVILALPFALLVVVGVGAHWIQHAPVFTGEKLKPDLSRINPMKGFSKLFGRAALVNFVKGLLKTGLVAAVIWMVTWPARDQIIAVVTLPVGLLLPFVQDLTMQMLYAALAVLGVIAFADYGWQYFERMRRLKMTRQEVRDEHKQNEGDPIVKGRLRQIRSDRARKRMMAAVPKASVIITNPTHYAVALSYEAGKMGAPICVAKGVDSIALKIREIGQEHNVPIVENPPLARALYAAVDIDETIKPEHYKAVAQVIGYVMKLKNKAASARRPR